MANTQSIQVSANWGRQPGRLSADHRQVGRGVPAHQGTRYCSTVAKTHVYVVISLHDMMSRYHHIRRPYYAAGWQPIAGFHPHYT